MTAKELLHKSEKELQELLAELRLELRDLRFRASEGQLKTVHQVRGVKKDIARVMTRLAAVRKTAS